MGNTCPYCGADTIIGAIRCENCGRIIGRNKKELLALRMSLEKASQGDIPKNKDEYEKLNSWMSAHARALAEPNTLQRAIALAVNSLITGMSLLATVLVCLYIWLLFFPSSLDRFIF